MHQPSDFNESSPTNKSQNVPIVLWVLGGVGCGCLGLFVLGILAAIALPSFLAQANRAREAEAENYIGAMNRAQQAHYLEQQLFATTLDDLQLGIPPQTTQYIYAIEPPTDTSVMMTATALTPELASYTGAVFDVGSDTVLAQICRSERPSPKPPAMPTLAGTGATAIATCPPGSRPLP